MSNRLPCGHCDIGVYDPRPFIAGIDAFAGKQNRKEAAQSAPWCKCQPHKKCAGALDWIASVSFPIDEEECARLREYAR